jgi:hypothetical protein
LRLVEPVDDIPLDDIDSGYDTSLYPEPVERQDDFFRTVGAAILKGTNPNQAALRASFQKFVLETVLPGFDRRISEIETAIAARAREDRRARMSAIPSNPQAVRAATLKARRAARTESRKHFSIVAKEEG